jgi:hypothetical protein
MTTITLESVLEAIERAKQRTDDWQAQCLEILLLPKVARVWKRLNPRFKNLRVERVNGLPHVGYTSDDNRAVSDWTQFSGYLLIYFDLPDGQTYGWNAVRADGYGHSAGTCWNGVGRETICRFIESLRMIALGHDHDECRRALAAAGINLVESVELVA